MKVINNSLTPVIDRWSDPGDYPSGAGSCALAIRSRQRRPERGHARRSGALRPIDGADAEDEDNRHAIRIARPCLNRRRRGRRRAPKRPGWGVPQISRGSSRRWGLERMRRIGVHESAAVGAELLDDLLARHRPDRDGLLGALQRRHVDRAGQRLRHAERDEDDGEDDRDRQQT